MAIVNGCVALRAAGVVESVVLAAKLKTPAFVGVPETKPTALSVTPGGSEPDASDQL
jgi:hypothetical protein